MHPQEWLERWREGRTPFHLEEVNPWLLQFQDRLALSGTSRVLVPLCGKSVDMAHLAGLGAHVTGVDLAEEALQAFAAEHKLGMRRESSGGITTLTSPSFSLLAADFLALTGDQLGLFDAVWDRAALIALPEASRTAYVQRLMEVLKPGGRLLLVNLEYDEDRMEGPPFSVPRAQVDQLFTAAACIDLLASKEISRENILRQNHDLPSLIERAFLITRPSHRE